MFAINSTALQSVSSAHTSGVDLFADTPLPASSACEDVIRRAHQLVSPDLYVIERLHSAGMQPDYQAILGAQLQTKIAALILLTRQKLLDLQHYAEESREAEEARRDISTYVRVIYHLKAVEAQVILYDIAAHYGMDTTTGLWANVRSRCLYLLALRPECYPTVFLFLAKRPAAQQRLCELTQAGYQEIARPCKQLLAEFEKYRTNPGVKNQFPTPPYVLLYRQYERELPDDQAVGVSLRLTVRDRIEQAVVAGDIPTLMEWITDGAIATLRETLRFSQSSMSRHQYVDLLERALHLDNLTAERKTVIVRELGSLNRQSTSTDGDSTLNRILAHAAMLPEQGNLEVAKSAVRELGSVGANKQLMAIMEHAPVLAVAEEAIGVMKERRQLALAKESIAKRPELLPAYRAALQYVQSLRNLVELIASCLSDDTMQVYLDRLKAEKAIVELQELAKRHNRAGEVAIAALCEINPSLAVHYYE